MAVGDSGASQYRQKAYHVAESFAAQFRYVMREESPPYSSYSVGLDQQLLLSGAEEGGNDMLLLILLLILVFAAVPAWPYSRGWGYYPSGGLGTILLILVVLMLLGMIHI
jgi:hypothetical protein